LRHAHRDGVTIPVKAGHCMRAGGTVENEDSPGARHRAIAHQPCRHAARAIAALPRSAAVGVPDAVAGDGAGTARRFDGEDLVAADAGVAIGQRAAQCGIGCIDAVAQVEHDEVVAGAMHLGELHVAHVMARISLAGVQPDFLQPASCHCCARPLNHPGRRLRALPVRVGLLQLARPRVAFLQARICGGASAAGVSAGTASAGARSPPRPACSPRWRRSLDQRALVAAAGERQRQRDQCGEGFQVHAGSVTRRGGDSMRLGASPQPRGDARHDGGAGGGHPDFGAVRNMITAQADIMIVASHFARRPTAPCDCQSR
jgi:hypothetical protein